MTAIRKIAKSANILDGMVTVWMLPIVTIRHNITVDKVKSLFGVADDSDWLNKISEPQYIFMLIEGHIVDIEFGDMDENDERYIDYYGLKQYWDNRIDNDVANNWLWFSNTLTANMVYVLYNSVFVKTRRDYIPKIEGADILKTDPPPPDTEENQKKTGSGRKRTKKKSASTSKS